MKVDHARRQRQHPQEQPHSSAQMGADAACGVLNRATPMAMVVGIDSLPNDATPNARMALAVSLFKDGGLSWMQAASYAHCTASDFMKHLSRLGIPVIDQSPEEVVNDIDTLQKWLAQ